MAPDPCRVQARREVCSGSLCGHQNYPLRAGEAPCESCELSFISGQDEDYSPGDGISESSEKLLQRGRGRSVYVSIYVISVKGEFMQSSTYNFCRRLLLVTRNRCHHL